MRNIITITAMIALLTACGEAATTDTVEPGTGGTDTPSPAAAISVGDLKNGTYDSDTNELVVQIALDTPDGLQAYQYIETVGGYDRFEYQDDPLDRAFSAYARTSEDGSVTAIVVSDGGQFNRFLGGAVANQASYSAPASGLVSYQGGYVGLLNFGPPASKPPEPSLIPREATRVTGTVFLNADFVGNKLNGAIYDRTYVPDVLVTDLDPIILTIGDIAADGSFAGGAEFDDLTPVGTYAGVFGGVDASAMAGTLNIADHIDGIEEEQEYGIFVLEKCGFSGPAICDEVNPAFNAPN